jgi:hypothetical protein
MCEGSLGFKAAAHPRQVDRYCLPEITYSCALTSHIGCLECHSHF